MRIRIAIFCIVIASVSLSGAPQWQKEFSKEGIDVFTRAIEGTSIKEFKGTGVIDGTIEEVNAVLDNIPAYKCTRCGKVLFSDETVEKIQKLVGRIKRDSSEIVTGRPSVNLYNY